MFTEADSEEAIVMESVSLGSFGSIRRTKHINKVFLIQL